MIKNLQKALKEDQGLRIGYVANIAMPFYDMHRFYQSKTGRRCSSKKDLRIISNAAAEYFVDLLVNQQPKTNGDGSYAMVHSMIHYLNKAEKEFTKSINPNSPKGKRRLTTAIQVRQRIKRSR